MFPPVALPDPTKACPVLTTPPSGSLVLLQELMFVSETPVPPYLLEYVIYRGCPSYSLHVLLPPSPLQPSALEACLVVHATHNSKTCSHSFSLFSSGSWAMFQSESDMHNTVLTKETREARMYIRIDLTELGTSPARHKPAASGGTACVA